MGGEETKLLTEIKHSSKTMHLQYFKLCNFKPMHSVQTRAAALEEQLNLIGGPFAVVRPLHDAESPCIMRLGDVCSKLKRRSR